MSRFPCYHHVMTMLSISVVVLSLCQLANSRLDFHGDPLLRYNTTELIHAAGFDSEEHRTTTADGYILPLFRIVSRDDGGNGSRPAVLLMHGMLTASDSWLLQGRKKDLAFMMQDAGYDVWLSDFRGDVYTRKHISLSPNDPAFWQFSYHEMGVFDLPAIINKILAVTGHPQLSYVCHSMGCTAFFVMASHSADMSGKARVMAAMAPAANWNPNNITPQKRILLDAGDQLVKSFDRQKRYEVLQRTWFTPILAEIFCGPGVATQDLCYDLLFFWAGSQTHRISRKVLPRALSHAPAGSGLKVPQHFLEASKGVFAPMDYGAQLNQQKYGSPTPPPPYNISRVVCPVSVHYSVVDGLASFADVKENLKLIPKLSDVFEYPDLSHVDYVWGADAWKQLFPRVIATLNYFNDPPHR